MYREHAKRLLQTGGGIGDEANERLRFYIPPGGPDAATSSKAQNLWRKAAL